MGKTVQYNALLFNKEIAPRPYKYRLFFAVENEEGQPEIHRLYVRSARHFKKMTLGSSYNIVHSGIRLVSEELLSTQMLSDTLYFRLIDLKDLEFMGSRDAKRFGIYSDDYDPSEFYYTFKTYKSLVEYTPTLSLKLSVYLLKMLGYILSMFIPVGLYILGLYSISLLSATASVSVFHAIAVHVAAILSLPIVFWMINTLHTFFDTCLLSIPAFRDLMLSQYALRWGGIKKNISLSGEQKKYYTKTGLVSLILLIIGIVLIFIAL